MTTIDWGALVPKDAKVFKNKEYCKCSPKYGWRMEINSQGKCGRCLSRGRWLKQVRGRKCLID